MATNAKRRKPQVNVSLSDRDRLLADVVAAADGVSVAELLRGPVERYLRRREGEQEIKTALEAIERHRSARASKRARKRGASVTSITRQRRAKGARRGKAG